MSVWTERFQIRMGDGLALFQGKPAQTDFQHPTLVSHGMGSIGAKVHQHLMYLSGVGIDHAIGGFNPALDFNRRGQRRS